MRLRHAAALAALGALALGVAGASATRVGSSSLALPVTNGAVDASAISGSTLYIGGAFSEVGPDTGAFASIDRSTGSATPPLSPIIGSVRAVVSDRHGGW